MTHHNIRLYSVKHKVWSPTIEIFNVKCPPGLHQLWPRAASIRMRQMDATWQVLFRFLIGDDVPKSSKKVVDKYANVRLEMIGFRRNEPAFIWKRTSRGYSTMEALRRDTFEDSNL